MATRTPHWSHVTHLEVALISARQARAFVSTHLIEHRLLYLVHPARLVVSELATNALVHAQTAFSVTLSGSDTRVLLTVRDDSPALPQRRAAQDMDTSGRGLEIVAIVSSDWGIDEDETGSKAVWASFAIRGSDEY